MAKPFLGGLYPDLNQDTHPKHEEESLWPQESENGWTEAPSPDHQLDLSMLWQVLEKHKKVMEEKEEAGKNIDTTWELVVVQGVILILLILISIMWAFCCKRRCFSTRDPSVAEALRKLSRDLPPSYSTRDLHTLGISVNDHLHPPPAYLELFRDDLQYLDLEAGHSRMAKLSFCSPEGGPPRLARLSVASCSSCSSESPVVVPVQRTERTPRTSISSASSASSASSRKSSRNSRVSFSEDVEFSNGSVRRLSTNTLSNMSGTFSTPSSRKSSSSSDGSRKSSLIEKVREAKRKMGSNGSINNSFIDQLDEDLKAKLDRIGDDPVPVDVERQAERAARVCDIIHEEK